MLSELFLPHWQRFNQLPIFVKIVALAVIAWLLVFAWPIVVAGGFGMVVISTMQSPKVRFGLIAAMLAPALLVEVYWGSALWAGVFRQSGDTVAKPSQVALVDHQNQVQGTQSQQSNQVRVVGAVSGDTINVDQRGELFEVRLAGIEAPRPGEGANAAECFGDEAKMFLNSLLENRMVEVIEDSLAVNDDNGSQLRYIRMSDGTKVNELMLEAGLAREWKESDYEQKDIFVELATAADQNNKGLWASCADDGKPKITPAPTVVVTPTPRVGQAEPTGVSPVKPSE